MVKLYFSFQFSQIQDSDFHADNHFECHLFVNSPGLYHRKDLALRGKKVKLAGDVGNLG